MGQVRIEVSFVGCTLIQAHKRIYRDLKEEVIIDLNLTLESTIDRAKSSVLKRFYVVAWTGFKNLGEIKPPMTIGEFTDKQAQELARVPPEFRPTLAQMAYEEEHSRGYESVLGTLKDFIILLEGPIKEFEKRIKTSKTT